MPELVNWLLDKGFHVLVFTNLFRPEAFLRVKKSYRFQIRATLHHVEDEIPDRFDAAYKLLKDHHNINVDEIGDVKFLSYSNLKPFMTVDALKDNEFRFSPDGKLYTSCYSHYYDKSI
jgi:hypothetical protein